MSEHTDRILAQSHRMLVAVAGLQTVVCLVLVGVVLRGPAAPAASVVAPVAAAPVAAAECACPEVAVAPVVEGVESAAAAGTPVAEAVEEAPAPVVLRPAPVVVKPTPVVARPTPVVAAQKPAVAPPAVAAPAAEAPEPEGADRGDAVVEIPPGEPFTSAEVSCPRSGYRARNVFVKGVASFSGVPATEHCNVDFKGGPPARNVIRGGEHKRCTFERGQAVCS